MFDEPDPCRRRCSTARSACRPGGRDHPAELIVAGGYRTLGPGWAADGSISARFCALVYHGNELRIDVSEQSSGLNVALINIDDIACATAKAGPPELDAVHDVDSSDYHCSEEDAVAAWNPAERR